MKKLWKVFARLWSAWFLLLFAFSFLLQYPLYALLLHFPKFHALAHRLRVLWAWVLFVGTGLRLRIKREYRLTRNAPYIYCANHASYLDIPVLAAAVPGTLHFMAKHELAKIPLFGLFFRTIDIAVPRGHNRGSHRAYELAAARLMAGGNIAIFPEGGILPGAPTLKPFKSGAFKLAMAHNIAVVPISLIDNWQRLPDEPWPGLVPGCARVVVHQPLHPADFNGDEDALRNKTHQIIETTLNTYHENRYRNR
jgi:1-acyl-sn-glycerol-3-phosphate acyltransferase